MKKRKFLLVSTLILSSLAMTSLSSCTIGDSSNIVNEKKFSIKLNYDESKGGVFSDLSSGTLVESTKVKISIFPNDGYEISSIKINGTDHAIETPFYFAPIEGENTVAVEFASTTEVPTEETYTIKTLVTQGGVVTPNKESGVVGEKVTFEVTPDEGYELVNLKINDVEQDLSVREFTPVKGENTIQATFALIEVEPEIETYTIVVTESEGGVVVPSKTSGNVGETVSFSVTPDEGYELESLIINDLVRDLSTREFNPVKGVNIIKATFKELDVIPEEDTYSIFVSVTAGGVLTPSQTSGYVGDVVTFIVTPDEGYEISELYINEVKVDNSTRQFTPVKGENSIRCVFKKTEVPVETFTIKIIDSENGTVSVDKTSGNVGEVVNLTITPETNYQLSELLINNESVSLSTKEFLPIKGENTIEARFDKIRVIDKGLEYTGIANNLTTNFTDINDFTNTLYEGLSNTGVTGFEGETFKENLTKFIDDIDGYNLIAKRYGFEKDTIKSILNSTQFKDIIVLFSSKFVLSRENVAKIVNFVTHLVSNYSLEYSCGTIGLLGLYYGLTVKYNYSNGLAYESEIDLLDDAIETFKDDDDISSYAKTLKDNSTIDVSGKIKKYLDASDIVTEFVYKIASSVTTLYGANDQLIDNVYNLISVLGLGDNGNKFSATQEDYVELFKFLYRTIDNCFFSKKSFVTMVNALAQMDDPFDTLSSIYSSDINNQGMISTFKNVFELLSKNAEESYYIIKLIGKIASKVDEDTLSDIFAIFGDLNLGNDTKYAKTIVKIAKLINSSFTMVYPYEDLIKEYLNNSSEFISSLISIFKLGYIPSTSEIDYLDTKKFMTNLDKFASYDEDNLTSEQVDEVYSYYNELSDLITKKVSFNRNYLITLNSTYKVGDEFNYKVTLGNEDVTSSFTVKDFDSSYIHIGKVTLVSKEGINYYYKYIVTNSGNNLLPVTQTVSVMVGDDIGASVPFTRYDNKGNTETIYLEDLVHSVINTSSVKEGVAYVKYSNDYFFFRYRVLSA